MVEAKELADRRLEEISFIAINYLNHLQYLGRVRHHARWEFDEANGTFDMPHGHGWSYEVVVDLREFACKLQGREHYIFLLDPILGWCRSSRFRYRGEGPFIIKKKYIDTIEEILANYEADRGSSEMGA